MNPVTPPTLASPKLSALAEHGGWFCERCERYVNLGLDHSSPARCPRCGKRTAVWHPPVFPDAKKPAPLQAPAPALAPV